MLENIAAQRRVEGSNEINILVIGDQPILRAGLAALVAGERGMRIVGEACNRLESIQQVEALRPEVILLDLQMLNLNGLEEIGRIRAQDPTARIIALSSYAGDVLARRAIKAGAQGYLLKDMIGKELAEAIRAVHGGLKRISLEIANQLAYHLGNEPLSEREVEVLRLIAHGNSNKRIALLLGISDETAKGHVKSILAKLDARDRTHAVTLGLIRGIIQLQQGTAPQTLEVA